MKRGSQTNSETFSPERYKYLSTKTIGPMRCVVVVIVLTSMIWVSTPVVSAAVYARLPGYCLQPPPRSEGLCTIDIEGFYFDQRTSNCERYEVGGCRSIPGQSFGSRDDCLATCVYRTRRIQDLYTIE